MRTIGNKLLFIIFFLTINLLIHSSVFDKVKWEHERSKKEIQLYLQKEKNLKINFYKAVIKVDDIELNEIVYNILSFDKYDKIFAKTNFFKIVKTLGKDKYIVNAELNFFPYRNRNYYIKCIFSKTKINSKNVYSIEWSPVDQKEHSDVIEVTRKAKNVNFIHGRWTVVEDKDNSLDISIEYHNDWETNLPLKFVHEIEKYITIKNLKSMINYCRK